MPLDPSQLSAMQANAVATALVDSGQIIRNTAQTSAGDDLGGGGVNANWLPFGSPLPCRLKMHRPRTETFADGQVRSILVYEAQFPVGTAILDSDRFQVTTGPYPGLYSVAAVQQGQSEDALLCAWLEYFEA